MANEKKVLLAFGGEALTKAVSGVLKEAGFQIAILKTPTRASPSLHLPKERYGYLIQLGCNPRPLTEGTHHLLEKARKDGSNFLLISSLRTLNKPPTTCDRTCLESLRFAEAITKEFHQKHGVKTTILRLPILYGPGIPFKESGALGELLSEFAADQATRPGSVGPTLTVYGEGKDSNYYLLLDDAVEAVKTALTTGERIGTTYNALPPTPISSAAIAKLLRKLGGDRHEIHYHKGLTPIEEGIKPEGEPLPQFKPKTSLEEGILETLKALPGGERKTEGRTAKKQKFAYPTPRHPRKTRRPSKKTVLALAIFLFLISPALYIGGRAALAGYNLMQLHHQLRSFDLQAAKHSAEAASKNLAAINHLLNAVPPTWSSSDGLLRSLIFLSQGGEEAATALAKVVGGGETLATLIENLLKSRQGEAASKQTGEEFTYLAAILGETEDHLLTSQLHLTQVGSPFNRWVSSYLGLLHQGITAAGLGKEFASAAPELLGYQGERNYLILFQNSAEARAGGGFLGSLAQITLKDGGIKTLEFFDSYQFDTVGAAAPITAQKLLEVETFRLRENNFYASFPESGRKIGQLYEEAQGIKIDGVIGVNLLFAKELLTLSGPLELSESGRTVTSENLFEVTTEEVEKEFFPGSTRKRRFLQALGEELLNKLFTLDRRDYATLAEIIWSGLEKKDLLLFFEEGDLAQALVENGFDGRTKSTDGDFLMIIDSSYGTKANVWVKRSVDYKVFNANRADQLQGELTITWKHTGTAAWPSGTYTNLFRVLTPKGSTLLATSLNGEDYLPNMMLAEEAGNAEFATLLKVEPKTTAVLKLSYALPSTLNLEDGKNYSLWVQKQPGTIGDVFTFVFEEPLGKQISGKATFAVASTDAANGSLRNEGGNLTFEGSLEGDIDITVEIERKVP